MADANLRFASPRRVKRSGMGISVKDAVFTIETIIDPVKPIAEKYHVDQIYLVPMHR